MTDEEYMFKQTEIERKRIGRGDRNKKRGGGKYVRLPSDQMTKKEREAMNGEVKTFKIKPFYTWEEFKSLPDDLQIKHINSLITRYDVSISAISTGVFGLSDSGLMWYINNKNMKQYINATARGKAGTKGKQHMLDAMERYNAGALTVESVSTCETIEPETKPEQKPEPAPVIENDVTNESVQRQSHRDLSNVAVLLKTLIGTGAKLTIEITL